MMGGGAVMCTTFSRGESNVSAQDVQDARAQGTYDAQDTAKQLRAISDEVSDRFYERGPTWCAP